MRKLLYERRRGKEMYASGTWDTTQKERLLINGISIFFTVSVLAVLLSAFLHLSRLLVISIVCTVLSVLALVAALLVMIRYKSKEQPMEKHYYQVDERYDGIRGTFEDHTEEIFSEEDR